EGIALEERLPQNGSHAAAQVLAHSVPAQACQLCKLVETGSSRDVEVTDIPSEAQDLALTGCEPIVRTNPTMANRFPTSQTPSHPKAVEEAEHAFRRVVVRKKRKRRDLGPDDDRGRRRSARSDARQKCPEDARIV